MNLKLIALIALLWAPVAQALTYSQLRYYLEANGYSGDDVQIVVRGETAQVYKWNLPIPAPESVALPDQAACDAIFGVPAKYRKIVDKQILEMDAGEKAAVDANEAAVEAAALAARQAAKPAPLRNAEKKMVTYLVNEGAMPTNSLIVTPTVIEAAYDIWDALPGQQGDNKAAKYNRLLKKITLRGGSEFGVYAHP